MKLAEVGFIQVPTELGFYWGIAKPSLVGLRNIFLCSDGVRRLFPVVHNHKATRLWVQIHDRPAKDRVKLYSIYKDDPYYWTYKDPLVYEGYLPNGVSYYLRTLGRKHKRNILYAEIWYE